MGEKALKFNNIEVNKKEFHNTKQVIDLDLVDTGKIAVSDRFKHSEDGFKDFIAYQKDGIVQPLCIILPQMNGYIKYFDNGGNNMYFLTKNDEV